MDGTLSLVLIEAVLIFLAIAISKVIRLISPLDDSCKDAVDSIPTVSSPPHIVAAPPAIKYDVFLSFRGEDTRDAFSSYLYEALCNANIHTFMDHKLHKGQHIKPVLLQTIEESEISLIVFSQDYASSTWCMDELVHIMKCRDNYKRIVIPVFYHVDPSNIRNQNGSFGNGFAKLKLRFKDNQEKVQEWINALIQSAKLAGWDSKNIRPESKFIKKIVKDLLKKLNRGKPSFYVEGLVGIDHHIQKIEDLLSEARIVGIWGMGGIGKTTIAEAVFHKKKEQFEAFSFIGNVRKELARIGLDELQKKCLKELLKDEDVNTYNLKSTFVKSRLHRKKILLILDDVDDYIAIEDLIKVCDWFGEGSRIIITSRDMQVLKNTSAFTTYQVLQLDYDQALHLFSLKAFKQNEPSKSYLELSKWVVDYCKGNPLALIVLGCFLYGRRKEVWESAMKELNRTLHKGIFDVLKLSFDGLDDTQQNVFLDLVFFLNVEGRISLEDCMRRIYDSSVDIKIFVLEERSLISVHENGDIEMHALLMEMGLAISRQQLISNPEKPIRLWRHEDYHVFLNDKGIEAIRCLSLDLSKIRRRTTWTACNFQKMDNLLFLKVSKSDKRKPSKLTFCDDLDYLSEELRFFSWEEYPFSHVPLHFCSDNLITLDMPDSNIRQLWNGKQHFPNLKEIIVYDSKHLTALPDLSHAPKIERVDVDGCVNLEEIHSSTILGNLNRLWVGHGGPTRINIGGSMKGTSSGLVMVFNYLNLFKLSLKKVIMKVLVCGKIICGVGCKVVEMPLAEKEMAELRYLLPFVWTVELLERPIEYGHEFRQHYDYDYDSDYGYGYAFDYRYLMAVVVGVRMTVRRDDMGGERHVVGPLTREMINDHQTSMEAGEEEEEDEELMIDHDNQVVATTTLMEVEEEEEELMREYYCGGSKSSNATIFTRVPNSITRWSLLTELRLRKSDMVEDSLILNSLSSLSHASCKPRVDATLSFHTLPSAFTDTDDYYFGVQCEIDYSRFEFFVRNYGSLDPDYNFTVHYM